VHIPVFISWSGDESKRVADALHRWLPHFIQVLDPWMSATDIHAGSRWQPAIAENVYKCAFSIICVTPRNLSSPWLLFEAGALSNAIDAKRVCPFLIGVKIHQLQGPLSQFQAVEADEAGIRQLIYSLNHGLGDERLSDGQVEQSLEKFLPELKRALSSVRETVAKENETRFQVIQNALKRTENIAFDLQELLGAANEGGDQVFVRYSGFLSPFAISDEEIEASIARERGNANAERYYEGLRREREAMLALARNDRCVVRCIITPPREGPFPCQLLPHTTMRLKHLYEFLNGAGRSMNIEWAISPFQQKNTYIIGTLSYFEGFKQGAQEGYQFSLRYAAEDEVSINIMMYDELFQRLSMSTLTTYPVGPQLDTREALREATLKCVRMAIDDVAKSAIPEASANAVIPERPLHAADAPLLERKTATSLPASPSPPPRRASRRPRPKTSAATDTRSR